MEETAQIIRFFISHEKALEKISLDELRDVASLASIILGDIQYSEELKRKSWKLLCDIAILGRLPISERWALYWQASWYSFTETKYDDMREWLERTYASIFQAVEREMPSELLEGGQTMIGTGQSSLSQTNF